MNHLYNIYYFVEMFYKWLEKKETDLSLANLSLANLGGANLSQADLSEAYPFEIKFLTNKQIKSAKNWDKAIYTEAEWNHNTDQWIFKDKKANKKMVEKISNNESFNP